MSLPLITDHPPSELRTKAIKNILQSHIPMSEIIHKVVTDIEEEIINKVTMSFTR
jgi:hypothetical protein